MMLRAATPTPSLLRPCLTVLLVAACLLPITAVAKSGQLSGPGAPPASPAPAEKRTYTDDESSRMGAEVQRRAEERQRGWDRKMKALSGSICKGC